MSFTIPDLLKESKKNKLICLSTGIYEKKYLYFLLENHREIIDYICNPSELELIDNIRKYPNFNKDFEQIDGRYKNADEASKAINEILEIVQLKLEDQFALVNDNSNYILAMITDCDKGPLDAFNKLKNDVMETINRNNYNIDYYFIFSYRGFEDWMKFYLENGECISNLQNIKDNIKSMIKEKHSTIFNRHRDAINKYRQLTNYNSPLDNYESIIDYPYSDFPYFLEYLEQQYNIPI
ncbi:hypothetical protein A966_08969 [Brachyspira hampsonii 30446]|uniref:Uncharacterized protein n=1 Tax=Brachyspira hampsonii 30446 TaxID=1289135 RepID=A0A2U4FBA1_9SPIR|nr:hypothetical protein [Brachyspira hampsonii]EKV56664.1 hypothetical protein A966_08969 [Brachyspira hampsonii 30446]MBW5394241.1 hypothetical protein [Brachyspira hampsonii]OEJ20381.1 hypothetical protein A9495_12310 [Brachyspira hampsonii]